MDIRHFSFWNFFKPKEETFKWYFTLIYLLILIIPFNHKEAFSIYDPDLVWSKYVLVLLSAIGLYFFVKNFKAYVGDPFLLFLLAFVGFQVLSLLQTRDINSSLRLIAFQMAIAFAYIPIRNFIFEHKDAIKDLLVLYNISFVPVIVFLIIQIYLETNYKIAIGGVWPVGGYPTRYGSTFWDINHFGAFCSALSLILLGFCFKKDIKLPLKAFSIFTIICALVALYLTSSRSSMIGFAAGLIVLAVLLVNNFKLKIKPTFQYAIYYLGTVSFVSGFIYFIYLSAESLKASLLYRSVSFFSHLFLLKVGIIVGFQNFLFGIGANSFSAYFRETEWANSYYYIDRAALDLKLPLHNLWLEVLAETGLVSFFVFLAFWILLLIGLYRIYKSQRDFIALGFIGGIVSFLVAGFMYSYKSEFFWMFILIAAAYVSKSYFNRNWKQNFASLKSVLCPHNCDARKIILLVLSAFILLIPLIFITHPLSKMEVSMFSGAFKSNLLTDKYTEILILFKYIIGNYTYTGRTLSLLLYLGSISLLFLTIRRYVGSLYSLVITSILFGIANIIEPNLLVSIKFYIVFGILSIAGFFILLASLFNRDVETFKLEKKLPLLTLIAISFVVILFGLISNNMYFKRAYSNDLTFLLELAYNRRLMDKSLIEVSEDIDPDSVYYFSDEISKDNNGFHIVEADVVTAEYMDFSIYPKNLFIFSEEQKPNVNKILGDIRTNPKIEVVELKQGDYNLVLIELKAAPVAQSQ